jgi:antitoxin CptB
MSAQVEGRARPAGTSPELDAQARRLLWHCRRGMKELDVLLERFARATLPHASAADCAALAQLLALPDPVLAGCLLGGEAPPEAGLAPLLERIRGLCRLDARAGVFCR